jgi:hypothetical protein
MSTASVASPSPRRLRHPIIRRGGPLPQVATHPAQLQRLIHNSPTHATRQRRATQLARDIDAHPHREELLHLIKAQLRDLSQERAIYSKHGR